MPALAEIISFWNILSHFLAQSQQTFAQNLHLETSQKHIHTGTEKTPLILLHEQNSPVMVSIFSVSMVTN
jgi:hypothetical protein